MRTIVIIGATLLLSACGALDGFGDQKSQIDALQMKLTAEQQRTTTLEERVAALEQKAAAAEAGSWVLWERRKLLKYAGPGVVMGPTPARPSDAFDTKEACLAGAVNAARIHGGAQGQATWVETTRDQFGSSTDQVFYACLPKGVPLSF